MVDPNVYLDSVNTRVSAPFFETPTLSLEQRKQALEYSRIVSRRVHRGYRMRQLEHLGAMGKALAWLASTRLGMAAIERIRGSALGSKGLEFLSRRVRRRALSSALDVSGHG